MTSSPPIIPSNLDFERGVLGLLCLEPEKFNLGLSLLKIDYFFHPSTKAFFRVLEAIREKGLFPDPPTVLRFAQELGVTVELGGVAGIGEIMTAGPTWTLFDGYRTQLAELMMARNAIKLAEQLQNQILDEPSKAPGMIAEHLASVQKLMGEGDSRSVQYLHDESEGILNRMMAAWERGRPVGLEFNLPFLSKIGPLEGEELVVLAATPGNGKSTLAAQIALNVRTPDDHPPHILFATMEMSSFQVVRRMIAAKAGIDAGRVRSGALSEKERRAVIDAAAELGETRLAIYDKETVSPSRLLARAQEMVNQNGKLDLIVLDYLQLMEADIRTDSDNARITAILQGVKAVQKELGVPCLCLSQLNRDSRKTNRKPQLHDLRGSGSIEQDANVVLFIHREAPDQDSDTSAVLIVGKNRDGVAGIEIPIEFLPNIATFREPIQSGGFQESGKFKEPNRRNRFPNFHREDTDD